MKRIWSPWRSRYIATFTSSPRTTKGKKMSLFTRALREKNDNRNLIVWRGKLCFIIMNRYPYNSGHLLIVPNRQAARLQDLTAEEMAEIMNATQNAIRALDRVMKPQGYNFGANLGRASGAGIDEHVHFHLVPRWSGDTNFMPVLSDVKVISEEIRDTLKKLKKELKSAHS